MIMAGALHGHMTVRSETQDKGRSLTVAQAEMAEHRENQQQAKPCFRVAEAIHCPEVCRSLYRSTWLLTNYTLLWESVLERQVEDHSVVRRCFREANGCADAKHKLTRR